MFKKVIFNKIEEYINEKFKDLVKREFCLYGKVEFQEFKAYNMYYTQIYIDGQKVLLYNRRNVFENILYYDGYKKIIYATMVKKKIIKEMPDFIKD